MIPRTFKTTAGAAAFIAQRPGRVLHITVLHDDACTPSRCMCRPAFEVREGTVENFLRGEREQAEWIRRVAS